MFRNSVCAVDVFMFRNFCVRCRQVYMFRNSLYVLQTCVYVP